MKVYDYNLGGRPVTVHFPESPRDLHGFEDFLARGDKVLGLDTETSGLQIYSPGFKLRLTQFGNADTAWVLRADLFAGITREALRQNRHFVLHNAPFDMQVLDRTLGVKIEELAPRVFDTYILAHLLDPRQRSEGGAGLKLKELSEIYVAADAPDTAAGLYSVFRKEYKATKETGWALIDIDHPTYVLYAGLDPILAHRLFLELAPLVRELGLDHLSQFEHHLASLLAIMQRRGLLIDTVYTAQLKGTLSQDAEDARKAAARYGIENVNSTQQVADSLIAMGETLTERTKTGWKVDKEVLLPLADLDQRWDRIGAREPNPAASAVLHAKRAEKWVTSYADAFLTKRDSADRIHPHIGGLQARTARMSVSDPPLQQLPSKDWKVRRAIIPDPGQVIIAADYQAVEMRVLAALADVKMMKEIIATGGDLHGVTAGLVYPDYVACQVKGCTGCLSCFRRNLMKGTGFGKVYGGGAVTLSRQTGADIDAVRHAIAEYDRVYPEIKRFGKRLQARADYGKKEVVTMSGRHLPLDRDRLYSATNYVCQSTARDLLAQAIVDVFDAGLGEHLLLPVHDELVAQAPVEDAEEVTREIGRLMESTLLGVPIESEAKVVGPSWATKYGCPPGLDYQPDNQSVSTVAGRV